MGERRPDRDLGRLYTVDGRAVLRFERRYRHPQETVWRAITEPAQLAQWFPAEVELDLRAGTPIRFRHPGEHEPGPGGTVRAVEPPQLFEFTWGDDVLRWELLPDGDGCLLRFTNTFDDRAGAGSFAAGWSGCLDGLEALLAGEPIPQPDRFVELHEQYVAAFGLATGESRDASGGWELRFERQVMGAPVATVWAALTDSRPPEVGQRPPAPATNPAVVAGLVTTQQASTDQQYEGGVPTRNEPQAVLEYGWESGAAEAGRVRWELYPGPGGARIVLTQTVPRSLADERATILAAWHAHLAHLVRTLCGDDTDRSAGQVEVLRRRYAADLA